MGTGRGPLPDDLETQLRAELNALAKLEGAAGVAADYVHLCRRIAQAQITVRFAIRTTTSAIPPLDESAPSPARRLGRELVVLDQRHLRDLLHALDDGAAAAHSPANGLHQLGSAVDQEPAALVRLAAAVLDGDAEGLDALAQRLAVPAPVLGFAGRLLAAPFVAEARYRRGPVPELDTRSSDTPDAGHCPTCGSAPALAVLCRDDGRRRLLCGLCGETWLVPRLMCVACGARDQSRLGLLSVGADDPRWVETCDVCRRYLKTVDERRLAEDHLLVLRAEDAGSLALDLMAEDAGYVRPDHSHSPLLEMTA